MLHQSLPHIFSYRSGSAPTLFLWADVRAILRGMHLLGYVICTTWGSLSLDVKITGLNFCAEEDRRERRRKLGLPEELSEEEKAAEAAKKAEAAKAKVSRALPVKPIALITQLRDVLVGTPPNTPLWNMTTPLPLGNGAPSLTPCTLAILPCATSQAIAHACSDVSQPGNARRCSKCGRAAQVGMKKAYANEDERVKACWATLLKYCGNIVRVRSNHQRLTSIQLCEWEDHRDTARVNWRDAMTSEQCQCQTQGTGRFAVYMCATSWTTTWTTIPMSLSCPEWCPSGKSIKG